MILNYNTLEAITIEKFRFLNLYNSILLDKETQ